MAIKSTFYDTAPGEGVKETSWAQSAQSRGPLYGVVGAGDLHLTAHPTVPYAVNVSPGKFWAHGVWNESTGSEMVQCVPPANKAVRWDMIASHSDWQPTGGGPTSFQAIQGSPAKALPTEMETRPGVVVDQPLWLVKWVGGESRPQEVIDLRCWASTGGVEVADRLALDYLGTPGAAVKLGKTVWRYEAQANGVWGWSNGEAEWVDLALGSTPGVTGVRSAGWWVRTGGGLTQARLVAGGGMIQIRGEAAYVNTGTPNYLPAKGWVVATLPPRLRPSVDCFILGTSGAYQNAAVYVVRSNGDIAISSSFTGTIAQFNGAVPV